jgi:hypothetical protein
MGPMTFIVSLALAAMLAAGVTLIWRGRSPHREKTVCPKCGVRNPVTARFCSACGEPLG